MNSRWRAMLAPLSIAVCALAANAGSAVPSVELAGVGTVPGNATDLSGLSGEISNANDGTKHVPMNLLGGFGSGIAYTGYKDFFIAVSDRGPFDGVTDPAYPDRFHIFRFTLDPDNKTITPGLVDTRLFMNRTGENFVGESSAFNTQRPAKSLRFDPEGVRVTHNGRLLVSDEYGRYIYEFNRFGKLRHRIRVPDKFEIENPSADGNTELMTNTKGRQANRGMEGLAISPDGGILFGLMQNPLIQDGALDQSFKRIGINSRLLKVNLGAGLTQEFVYQIEPGNGSKNGMNEILAVNDHQFMVIERDGKAGTDALTKKIYLIDIAGATDVSSFDSLPQSCTAEVDCPFTPVSKTLLIDMLSPDFGLAGPDFPEKIEGLAFGPDLPDGRHVLYVSSDNDLDPANPSYIFAFAIPPELLPDYQPQQFSSSFLSGFGDDGEDGRVRSSVYADEDTW